jgi:predicted nucleotidyltransferase
MKFDDNNIQEISKLCRAFNVMHLYVFGSYAAGDFSDNSDVDFLVEFNRNGFPGAFDQYSELKTGLENVLRRSVDLICLGSIRNSVFKREVEATKEIVYAA